jgi:hypothetical protein
MKVINFFGGPGCGKSTCASLLFYKLKKAGLKAELVTEYAKDMVYEGRTNILEDQLYILAKQSRRVSRLEGVVDYCVTDSPLLLSAIYNTGSPLITDLSLELFNRFDNVNIRLLRGDRQYQTYGRTQALGEAIKIDSSIFSFLLFHEIEHRSVISEFFDQTDLTSLIGEL